jgi:hypothetical protein
MTIDIHQEKDIPMITDIMRIEYRNAITACEILREDMDNETDPNIVRVTAKPYVKIILMTLGFLKPDRTYGHIRSDIKSITIVRRNDPERAHRDHEGLCYLREYFESTILKYPEICSELIREDKGVEKQVES